MFVFVAGRQRGKTRALAEWFLENPQRRAVIVLNLKMKEHLWRVITDQLPQLPGYFRDRIIPVDQWGNGSQRGQLFELAVDDLDQVLAQLLYLRHVSTQLTFVTINGTQVPQIKPIWHDTVDGEEVSTQGEINGRRAIEPRSNDDGRLARGPWRS